jgi:hypothetical protein
MSTPPFDKSWLGKSPHSVRAREKLLAEFNAAQTTLAQLSSPFPDSEEALKRQAQEKLVAKLKWRLFTLGCLTEAGPNFYPLTFALSADGKSITCIRCGRTSFNAGDVEHRYCGHCQMFHDDIWPPAREWWNTSYSE